MVGEPLTDARLAEIRERANKATPGVWWPWAYASGSVSAWFVRSDTLLIANDLTEADANFVRAARTDVPDLLDEIERLRRRLSER